MIRQLARLAMIATLLLPIMARADGESGQKTDEACANSPTSDGAEKCADDDALCWGRSHAKAEEALNAAYQALKERAAARVAATKKLQSTADPASVLDMGRKAKEEQAAREKVMKARSASDGAYCAWERALEAHAWRYRAQFRLRGAGAVGGVGVYGAGIRLDFRRNLYTAHGLYLSYDVASNVRFDEKNWTRDSSTDTVLRVGYTMVYKRLVVGASLPYRWGREGVDYTLSQSVFVAPKLGLEFRLDRDCMNGCFAPSLEVFVEPWFSVDGVTPTPFFFGVELALYGRGHGPIEATPRAVQTKAGNTRTGHLGAM